MNTGFDVDVSVKGCAFDLVLDDISWGCELITGLNEFVC